MASSIAASKTRAGRDILVGLLVLSENSGKFKKITTVSWKEGCFFSDACSFFVLGSCFLSFMVFVVFQHIGIQGRVPQRFIYFFVPTAGTQKSDL